MTPDRQAINEARRAKRRLVAIHLGVAAAANISIQQGSVLWCGEERTATTKVTHAPGVATCKECVRRFRAALPAMRKNGATVWKSILGKV